MNQVIMNRTIFGQHLMKALKSLEIDACNSKYRIVTVMEEGKKYNSKDDFVRLNVFPSRISERIFPYEEIVKRFSVFEPYYPLWIKVYVKEDVIELHTSLRFRRPSEVLRNHTGIEPFVLIDATQEGTNHDNT